MNDCFICRAPSNLGTDLCWRCTDGLSAFNRNPDRLRLAAEYLRPEAREKRIKVVRDGEIILTVVDPRRMLYEIKTK